MRREHVASALLLATGLGFALLGQFYFAYRRVYVWDGVLFWCVALLAFALLLRRTRRAKGEKRVWLGWRVLRWVSEHPTRALAAGGGLWLALLAGWLARRGGERVDFSAVLWLWLVGMAWFNVAFAPSVTVREVQARLMRRFRGRRLECAGMVLLLALALAVRVVDLEHIPANLGGDEGTQGVAALELVEPPLGNPFATGWFSVPTMSFLAYGLSMRIFGESVAGLRTLSALIGAATVLTTFLLARELWGRWVAWLAGATLACSHYHVHFSRLGSNQIADGLFVTLALWLLVRGLRSRQQIYFALAGTVTGLGWYGYFGARLVGLVVACYLIWRALTLTGPRFLARYGGQLLILGSAALVAIAPLLFHYAAHPETFASRFNQVSIFSSGWLAREQEITGRGVASLMLQQFWKSISAFHYTLDPTFWYRASIPLLDFLSGIAFVFGLAWATLRCRWPGNSLVSCWFWLALILGWVLTENPPSSMRLTIIAPALALFVALGLTGLARVVRRISGLTPCVLGFSSCVLLVAIAALNLHYYFVVYTPTRVYGNPNAEAATVLGRYLAQQDDDLRVYFYGSPFMYWDFGTLSFLARDVGGVDVAMVPPGGGAGGETLVPDAGQEARFVFLPQRLSELDAVRARYPHGVETAVHSPADERLLYVVYEVGP